MSEEYIVTTDKKTGKHMPYTLATGTHAECVERAKSRRDYMKKNGYPVSKIGASKWEIETPDDAIGISDREGYLVVCHINKAPKELR